MAMNPRTHPRGAAPDFSMAGLPPNQNPDRITNALWWLIQMRLRLEPLSENGGALAIKPGYHSYGSRLPDHGLGDPRTDHSIRRAPDRTGQWWKDYCSAHDWTFNRAHTGNYAEIKMYTSRLVRAMRDPDDTRPDDVYAYTIGQIDNDRTVEGWNEYKDEDETGDDSHLWHRHDSFRRNIVGDFWAMWKALTIDMGWTYAEWLASTKEDDMDQGTFNTRMDSWWNARMGASATDNPARTALRVAPWQQEVGRTGESAHNVLFGPMKGVLEATAANVQALSTAFAAFVAREGLEDAETDAALGALQASVLQVQATLDEAFPVDPGDGVSA